MSDTSTANPTTLSDSDGWDAGIQVALARAIATIAHRGQTDKIGAPYVTHVARVASRFDPVSRAVEHCAAWLHDVIEDTDVTAGDLRAAGVSSDVVDIVTLLTRTADIPSDEYYRRITTNPAAVAVKAADIDDNTSPARTRMLDDPTRERLAAKYADARRSLGLTSGEGS